MYTMLRDNSATAAKMSLVMETEFLHSAGSVKLTYTKLLSTVEISQEIKGNWRNFQDIKREN